MKTELIKQELDNRVWLDICKGLAVVLVILGHISIPWQLKTIIFSFHMPLFMVICGYCVEEYDVWKTFMKYLKALFVPYLVVRLLQGLAAMVLSPDVSAAGNALYASFNDTLFNMSGITTLFTKYHAVGFVSFAGCLSVSVLLYVIIRSCCARMPRIVQGIILLALSTGGGTCSIEFGFLPWSFDVALASTVFVAFGDFLRTFNASKGKKIVGLLLSAAVWLVLLIKGGQIDLVARSYPLAALSFVCAMAGCVLVFAASKAIEKLPYVSSFFAWIGRTSVIILGIHCLEMDVVSWDGVSLSFGWAAAYFLRLVLILLATVVFCRVRQWVRKKVAEEKASKRDDKRLEWPDVAKGIGIISIIMGHMLIPWIDQIVFVYHIPVFYLIAGYFLKKKDDTSFAKAKAKRLLIPYLVTCLCIAGYDLLKATYYGLPQKDSIGYWVRASLYGAGERWPEPFDVVQLGATWYLLALFFALVIVNHFVERKYYQVIIASIAYVGWASFDKTNVWLPWNIQAGMLASLYLLVGYECRKNGVTMEKIGPVCLIGMFLLAAFDIQYYKGVALVHNYFGNGWLDFFAGISASTVIIWLSIKISERLYLAKHILLFFGKNSLVILCAHLFELDVFPMYVHSEPLSDYLSLNGNQRTLLLLGFKIAYVVLAVFVVDWIKKLNAKVMEKMIVA